MVYASNPDVLYPRMPNSHERETRFLNLRHGHFDSPIVCTLSEPRSLDTTAYSALSYVWGPKIYTRNILVNDNSCIVTMNLEEALRHIRYEHLDMTLWVDALCIDQTNLDERNDQVTIMGDIFASAQGVVVWLGMSPHEWWDFDRCYSWYQPTPAEIRDRVTPLFASLASMPWFRRAWVIQELALSKKDPVLHCDTRSVAWSTFTHVWEKLKGSILKDPIFPLVSPGGPYQSQFAMLNSIRHSVQSQRFAELRSLLQCIRWCGASERKDKIFALRGMLRDKERRLIDVDYRNSTARVFANVVAHFFRAGFGPHFLTVMWIERATLGTTYRSSSGTVYYCSNDDQIDGLPSWVPEFSEFWADKPDVLTAYSFFPVPSKHYHQPEPLTAKYLHSDNGVSGSISIDTDVEVLKDLETLVIDVLLVGTVTAAFWFGPDLEKNLSILDLAREVERRANPTKVTDGECGRVFRNCRANAPLWRTLICNQYRESNRVYIAPDSFERLYWDIFPAGPQSVAGASSTDVGVRNAYTERLKTSLPRRTLFSTDTGFLGMGPPGIESGDEVTVWLGSKVPFLVRPTIDGESSYHTLVGPCYVGGIMDGEIVDQLYKKGHMKKKRIYVR